MAYSIISNFHIFFAALFIFPNKSTYPALILLISAVFFNYFYYGQDGYSEFFDRGDDGLVFAVPALTDLFLTACLLATKTKLGRWCAYLVFLGVIAQIAAFVEENQLVWQGLPFTGRFLYHKYFIFYTSIYREFCGWLMVCQLALLILFLTDALKGFKEFRLNGIAPLHLWVLVTVGLGGVYHYSLN